MLSFIPKIYSNADVAASRIKIQNEFHGFEARKMVTCVERWIHFPDLPKFVDVANAAIKIQL